MRTYVSLAEFREIKRMAEAKREKRAEKAKTLWVPRPKPKKTPSMAKWWDARLDALWGKAVRSRDRKKFGDVCRIHKARNCTGRNECGYHVISKARGHAIRWKMAAGVAACNPCNDGERWNRVLYDEHHIKIFGKEVIDNLKATSHQTLKLDIPQKKELAAELIRIAQENS